jgi:hypothetical protein
VKKVWPGFALWLLAITAHQDVTLLTDITRSIRVALICVLDAILFQEPRELNVQVTQQFNQQRNLRTSNPEPKPQVAYIQPVARLFIRKEQMRTTVCIQLDLFFAHTDCLTNVLHSVLWILRLSVIENVAIF